MTNEGKKKNDGGRQFTVGLQNCTARSFTDAKSFQVDLMTKLESVIAERAAARQAAYQTDGKATEGSSSKEHDTNEAHSQHESSLLATAFETVDSQQLIIQGLEGIHLDGPAEDQATMNMDV